jgi:predicted transcriptional regulator
VLETILETLTDLLFELSNDDRLRILLELEKGPMNLTRIAKVLDFTAQGTSRNMARLVQTSLISRNPEGDYALTPYGWTALEFLGSYRFLSENRQYFLRHDVAVLPYQFINRLGELYVSSFQGDFITTFAKAEAMMRSAEEYVYAMEEQFHPNAPPIVVEKMKLGVEFRTILPETIVPPPGFRPAAGVERRLLPSVKINLFMTDKEAIFGLPTLEGRFDYSIFVSEDQRFRRWCLDLFEYYWVQGRPMLGSVPNLV